MSTPSAARAIAAAVARGVTVATAESITGGMVAAALTSVPGASAVVRGGVVAYDAEVKVSTLGVPAALITEFGVVSEEVAAAMARGALAALDALAAVATTGVAGPSSHGGAEPGTVVVAAVAPGAESVTRHHFVGDRDAVRSQAADAAISALCEVINSSPTGGTPLG